MGYSYFAFFVYCVLRVLNWFGSCVRVTIDAFSEKLRESKMRGIGTTEPRHLTKLQRLNW